LVSDDVNNKHTQVSDRLLPPGYHGCYTVYTSVAATIQKLAAVHIK